MDDKKLSRYLQSVGQACFIRFFEEFSSDTLSRDALIAKLRDQTTYTEKSCASRVSKARSILNAGLADKALSLIASSNSGRVSQEVKEKARSYLVEKQQP
ncbi:hypothetical protein MACH16_15640 [Marinomonas pontica]|uniref:Uncharacterized protein n=1 Tax=Marinomonas pontica TaxID=264739 RepID=A0ABN6WLC7_9GAMM|nr:hypothetical protein MACH16_15640 [Marinomonas pontica]